MVRVAVHRETIKIRTSMLLEHKIRGKEEVAGIVGGCLVTEGCHDKESGLFSYRKGATEYYQGEN